MSRLGTTLATSHVLTMAAMEEASRLGQRDVDLDHLLLALTINEQPAGQVLRSLGITLAAARMAVHDQRADQLRSLGVTAPAPDASRITLPETGGYELTRRSMDLFGRASAQGGDASAVLRELLHEPSGLIDELLRRMQVPPDTIEALLDEFGALPGHVPDRSAVEYSATSEAFIPAPLTEIWAMLSDPSRMPEWDPMTVAVESAEEVEDATPRWISVGEAERPDGKPLPEQTRRRVVELLAADEGARIAWRFSYPDAPRSNTARLEISLSPAAGGAQLHLRWGWQRPADRRRVRRVLRRALSPVARGIYRFAIWMQLQQVSGGISRAFRSGDVR